MLDAPFIPSPVPANRLARRPAATYDFSGRMLDDEPQLLQQSFRLRYQVYCLERRFLPAENYPDGLEIDGFDAHSLHIGTLDPRGELVGTVRLVRPGTEGLPLFGHCEFFGGESSARLAGPGVVEVSRLAVSRRHRRPRQGGEALVVNLYKTLYQASKWFGFTHWLVATESSLQRLVARFGFPFRQVGPEVDYFGPVAPYLMDLGEFDRIIESGRYPLLETFLDGFDPSLAKAKPLVTA